MRIGTEGHEHSQHGRSRDVISEQHPAHTMTSECVIRWLTSALSASGKSSLKMAVVILGLSIQLNRQRFIMLTSKSLAEHGFHQSTAYRALRELESAGVVSVRRQHRVAPLVSIIWPEEDDDLPQADDGDNPAAGHHRKMSR